MTLREQVNQLNHALTRLQNALRQLQLRYGELADAAGDVVGDLEAGRPIGSQTAEHLCDVYHVQHEEATHASITTPSNH